MPPGNRQSLCTARTQQLAASDTTRFGPCFRHEKAGWGRLFEGMASDSASRPDRLLWNLPHPAPVE